MLGFPVQVANVASHYHETSIVSVQDVLVNNLVYGCHTTNISFVRALGFPLILCDDVRAQILIF